MAVITTANPNTFDILLIIIPPLFHFAVPLLVINEENGKLLQNI